MNDLTKLYMTLMTGYGFMMTAAYLAGTLVCLAYRRLSRPLILVSVGFAGEFLTSVIGLISAMSWQFYTEPSLLSYLFLNVISLVSTVVLVFGLGVTFADIRRQLILSKGPRDDFA